MNLGVSARALGRLSVIVECAATAGGGVAQCDAGPALKQHWVDVSCFQAVGITAQVSGLIQRCLNAVPASAMLAQHWDSIGLSLIFIRDILSIAHSE